MSNTNKSAVSRTTKHIIVYGEDANETSSLIGNLGNAGVIVTPIEMSAPTHDFRSVIDASANAQQAVIIIDACADDFSQAKHYATINYLLGVHDIVVAVRYLDKIPEPKIAFNEIVEAFSDFEILLRGEDNKSERQIFTIIPATAFNDDQTYSWFEGERLVTHLQKQVPGILSAAEPMRMSIQSVGNSENGQIEVTGIVSAGAVSAGEEVIILPGATRANITHIDGDGAKGKGAHAGNDVTLTLDGNSNPVAGNMLCTATSPVEVADHFETTLFWTGKEPLLASRTYRLKLGCGQTRATVTDIKYAVDTETQSHLAAKQLHQCDIGVCNISLDDDLPFEPFSANRELGMFTLTDRDSNECVGYGIIHFALRRSSNVHRHKLDIAAEQRAGMKGQQPLILWFTGLSGSGKSAIANLLEKRLVEMNKHTYTLDGDNIRHGLNKDLGFTDTDRVENIRRIGEVSSLMADAGLIVMVSFISPFRAERDLARRLAGETNFVEIHVDTPIQVAEARDVKGLYKKARAGEIANFTGIDSPYEPPVDPEITINTVEKSAADAADEIIENLLAWGILKSNN